MSPNVLRLLDDLAANDRARITTAEVRERLALSDQSASNLMRRLVDAGLLDRVARGSYSPRPLGELGTRAASQDIAIAVAAVFADEPHRIAFRSALDHHGLLAHPTRTIQVAMPRRVKLEQISGRRLRAIYEPAATIARGSERAGAGACVSTVERTLLESASRPAVVGGWTVVASALTQADLDPLKLIRLARELEADVALRRVASLSEALSLENIADSIAPPSRDATLLALDPRAPVENAWTDQRWRVRWPVSPREGRELIAA
jgi:predicted transcriptional regulator of viral defense system